MISEQNINEWAERYFQSELSEQEMKQLNEALDADEVLQFQWDRTIEILNVFRSGNERKDIRNLIQSVAANPAEWAVDNTPPNNQTSNTIPFRKYLRVTAAVASLVLCSSLLTYTVMNKNSGSVNLHQYQSLRRDLEHVKDSQSKIIDSLNKQKAKDAASQQIDESALYGGTGFAISNDGYIATNYHVVDGANAIYIQTSKGDKKAFIVAREPKSDIAILKIEDKDFKFSKSSLPYSISKSASSIGQQVFSIGYPKDDIVYNQGYISCQKGYDGDMESYQLEMTANPGQSGSPVFDRAGNVIAVITGKQSNTSGTTYAVQTSALINLVQSLPKSQHIVLQTGTKVGKPERTEQVNKMKDFVFSIKVN
ncbi:trypsin-like peptidase domain-containing protein [Taibaiella lutea]|uniref:Trypsin-like peptidase domain-containing protein n=1 Tax=Taibaiella lutea TaxID=2608001 RepID=A0A5M6CSV0_9BACT|nr:serine protease [Taibaiella lutea]KAA5537460.1 trypsin-like peptidase domain-containing protein [Taibaiella lutea]